MDSWRPTRERECDSNSMPPRQKEWKAIPFSLCELVVFVTLAFVFPLFIFTPDCVFPLTVSSQIPGTNGCDLQSRPADMRTPGLGPSTHPDSVCKVVSGPLSGSLQVRTVVSRPAGLSPGPARWTCGHRATDPPDPSLCPPPHCVLSIVQGPGPDTVRGSPCSSTFKARQSHLVRLLPADIHDKRPTFCD